MRPTAIRAAFVLLLAVARGVPAEALDARITEVRTVGPTVRASLDLHNLLSDKFRGILESGGALHVRVQTEMWEDRPLWDRLVRPALVTVFRIMRDPATAHIAISDAFGQVLSYPSFPQPLPLRVDVVPADAVTNAGRYYIRMIATVGTIAERDIDDAGEAVFGQDESSVSVGAVGKMVLRAVLQAADYLQSVSAEARTRRFEGRELRPGFRQ
jgi:hypothetical protein